MNIEYYPKKTIVNRAKYTEPMIAIIDLNGENAVVAPYLEVETHNNLLRCSVKEFESLKKGELDDYFSIFFDKDVADWSYNLPKNYKELDEKEDRAKQYYMDGFSAISTFLKELNFLIGINIPKRFR